LLQTDGKELSQSDSKMLLELCSLILEEFLQTDRKRNQSIKRSDPSQLQLTDHTEHKTARAGYKKNEQNGQNERRRRRRRRRRKKKAIEYSRVTDKHRHGYRYLIDVVHSAVI